MKDASYKAKIKNEILKKRGGGKAVTKGNRILSRIGIINGRKAKTNFRRTKCIKQSIILKSKKVLPLSSS